MSKRLEIEVDYDMSDEEYKAYLNYRKTLPRYQAAMRVAQDLLEYTDAIVQGAEVCDN